MHNSSANLLVPVPAEELQLRNKLRGTPLSPENGLYQLVKNETLPGCRDFGIPLTKPADRVQECCQYWLPKNRRHQAVTGGLAVKPNCANLKSKSNLHDGLRCSSAVAPAVPSEVQSRLQCIELKDHLL